MTIESWVATFVGMAIQAVVSGVVGRGKPVRLSGQILTACLCLATAIIIYALGDYQWTDILSLIQK
mgnify:CR=1 FL=1